MPPTPRFPSLRCRVLPLLAGLASGAVAHAATDGALGAESAATSTLTFVKDDAVQISGVDDIDLGARSHLSSAERVVDKLCVYSSTGSYAITASSANGAFELRSGDAPGTIPYRLQWISGQVHDLEYGVPLGGLRAHVDLRCRGRTNASFRLIVSPRDFNGAEPGAYSDTLVLVVTPG